MVRRGPASATPRRYEGPSHAVSQPLPFVHLADWDSRTVPSRAWAVLDRIPLRNVTLLPGEGAAGKSTILKHLLAATALGREWLDTMPDPGPALYLNAEDDADELHRRLADIRAY